MTEKSERACKDCLAETPVDGSGQAKITRLRPATFPGPRCYSHHMVHQKATKERAHRLRTETNFGLPPGGYDKLLEAQDGACGGCGKVPGPKARRMAVDHDHTCCPGKESCGQCVRGLLCWHCNDTLATFRDDEYGLRRLADYLTDWPSRKVEWTGMKYRVDQ